MDPLPCERVSKPNGLCAHCAPQTFHGVVITCIKFLAEAFFCYQCRKLKLNNKKVQQAVVNVDGALELLQASGFELVFEEASPEPETAHISAAPSNAAVTQQDGQAAAPSQVQRRLLQRNDSLGCNELIFNTLVQSHLMQQVSCKQMQRHRTLS